MNSTLGQLVASARADELRRLERTASDRPDQRRFRRLPVAARRGSPRAGS
jgi:hypothetical protein